MLHVSAYFLAIIRHLLITIQLYISSVPFSMSIRLTDYGLDGPGIESRWAKFFAPVQTDPGAHPASCTRGTGSFPGVKSGQGVTLTPHPLLVPWLRKCRAIPLLPLWTVRPVQSLSACTRVTFTFKYKVLSQHFSVWIEKKPRQQS
jgi:DNA-binding transcriptional LysR family regulator